MNEVPKETKSLLESVEIFKKDIEPQELIGPMICTEKIKISDDELKFLIKGPKYMLRTELDKIEYSVELDV